jgi:glutamate dehydrogenase (NAD(P)+)
VQGFGKVGALTAQYLHDAGVRVVAVSDVTGALHRPGGLDVTAVRAASLDAGSLRGIAEGGHHGDLIARSELLRLDVDVLVPAALEGVITERTAPDVRARWVVEAANGPTTPEADLVLADAGVHVVPDILANAGGVVGSYLEWSQNIQGARWSEDVVDTQLDRLMRDAYDGVATTARTRHVTLRQAATAIGVGRVAEAMALRGPYHP